MMVTLVVSSSMAKMTRYWPRRADQYPGELTREAFADLLRDLGECAGCELPDGGGDGLRLGPCAIALRRWTPQGGALCAGLRASLAAIPANRSPPVVMDARRPRCAAPLCMLRCATPCYGRPKIRGAGPMSIDATTTNGAQVAIYIDFDNVVISRYDELHGPHAFRDDRASSRNPSAVVRKRLSEAQLNLDAIIDFASSFGTAAITRAYADWSSPIHASYREQALRRSIDLVQLFPMTGTKNGADIRLAIDVIDDLSRYPALSHVVVVAGDSDYVALAQRCKRLGRRVIGIGAARSVGQYWRRACDEFRLYGNLPGVRAQATDTELEPPSPSMPPSTAVTSAAALLAQACELGHLRSEQDWLAAGNVKNLMIRLDPTFDESAQGHQSFSAFLRTMTSVVTLKEGGAGYDSQLKERGDANQVGGLPAGEQPVEPAPAAPAEPEPWDDLRKRLIASPAPLTDADERCVPTVIRTLWREVSDHPDLSPIPRAQLLARLTTKGMDETAARRVSHVVATSGLPFTLHDGEGHQLPNPELTDLQDTDLIRLLRGWNADRARNFDGYDTASADLIATALYGPHPTVGVVADIAAALSLASVTTMRRALGPRFLPPLVLWDVANAAANLGPALASLTAGTFAEALTPGLLALERDPETVDMGAAYLSLSEAGLCGDGSSPPAHPGPLTDANYVAAPVVTLWARRLIADGHLSPAELTSLDAFFRLTLPDRSDVLSRGWVKGLTAQAT